VHSCNFLGRSLEDFFAYRKGCAFSKVRWKTYLEDLSRKILEKGGGCIVETCFERCLEKMGKYVGKRSPSLEKEYFLS